MVRIVHRRLQPQNDIGKPVGECLVTRPRVVASLVLMMPLLAFFGCAPLEPMAEPEVSDLQLTVETLKTAVRDAQRTVTELRTELESRRKDLADAQVARAQLEGRVREAERRLLEARQVVELQREELAAARNERERVARTGRQLQGHLKQLQKQLTDISKRQQGQADVTPASRPSRPSAKVPANPVRMEKASAPPVRPPAVPPLPARPASVEAPAEQTNQSPTGGPPARLRNISVRVGDTLWSIAQRYQVDLNELRILNELADNRILPGQALWLPAPRSAVRSASETGIKPGR